LLHRLREYGGGSLPLGVALWALWPVLVAHHEVRDVMGWTRTRGAAWGLSAATAGILGSWDGGVWSAVLRIGLLVWLGGTVVAVAVVEVGDPVLVPSPVDRLWATRISGEQPADPLGDTIAVVFALLWWYLAARVVIEGLAAQWPGMTGGLLALYAAALWAAPYDPRLPPTV
jgi:hypothetical protein